MHVAIEAHDHMSCEIGDDRTVGTYIGTLKYRDSEVGLISGSSLEAVRTQFRVICNMIDEGGMLRHGIIMLGYHNGAFGGDVLRVDGEIIGEWASDDEEWCHFTAIGINDITLSAPSPWILHDSIGNWVKNDDNTSVS